MLQKKFKVKQVYLVILWGHKVESDARDDVGDPEVSVQVHLGPGVHLGGNTAAEFTGRWLVGPRGVGGFSIMKRDMPFDLYMEIAPTIYLVDGAGWSMNGQIGLRHYM